MTYEDEERPGQAVDEMVAEWDEEDRRADAEAQADQRAKRAELIASENS
jgi:hypothetical protein